MSGKPDGAYIWAQVKALDAAQPTTPPAVSDAMREAVALVMKRILCKGACLTPETCGICAFKAKNCAGILLAPAGSIAPEIDRLRKAVATAASWHDRRASMTSAQIQINEHKREARLLRAALSSQEKTDA